MPEEKPAVEDQILAGIGELQAGMQELRSDVKELRTDMEELRTEFQTFRYDTHGRLANLEGAFGQMNERVGRTETTVSQVFWGMISGFLVTITAVLITAVLK